MISSVLKIVNVNPQYAISSFWFCCQFHSKWSVVLVGFVTQAVPLIFYGIQHYLSISGSIILIPLIIVPAMGGSDVSYQKNALIIKWID